jgi:hypothetical protein
MRKQLSAICLNSVSNFELNLTGKKKKLLSRFMPPNDIDRILHSSDLTCQKSSSLLDPLIIYEESRAKF